jgi:glycosyltransferase involved in cell wall biosynthesis
MAASHRVDPEVNAPFPCAYPGGGSSAFDRRKFLEIGGFDEVYRPFYYEDTDLGSMAWKRGWKVLYQPGSVVYHEHRGTIGKKFSRNHIDRVVQRNAVAFAWKNIHNWRMLAESLAYTFLTGLGGTLLGNRKGFHAAAALWGCTKRMPEIMRCRWRAKSLACVNDEEALKRQQGGYFRDRFDVPDIAPARLQVLFLSPYHIEPPTHGGGLSMQATIRALSAHVDVHLLCFVDSEKQIAPHEALESYCASMTFLVRKHISSQIVLGVRPRVAVEFDDPDFTWAMHRLILLRNIDVIQVEYTMLAQYACDFARIPQFLFEHDLAFQSLGRQLAVRRGARETFAYMQLLRFELESAKHFARIQVCSRENREYLLEFAPDLAGRVDGDMRAVIDTGAYPFASQGREPNSVLFIGSFNHLPNVHALDWLLTHVWPAVLKGNPEALLYIAGSGSSEPLRGKLEQPGVRLLGFVDDIMELLLHKAVLISPILSGSGVRMKLLEAFACGIPVVSTRLGAEGLTTVSDEICALADAPDEFAVAVLHLLKDPTYASGLASRARVMVERERDSTVATRKLVSSYLGEVTKRRPKSHAPLLIKGPEQESPSARKAVV